MSLYRIPPRAQVALPASSDQVVGEQTMPSILVGLAYSDENGFHVVSPLYCSWTGSVGVSAIQLGVRGRSPMRLARSYHWRHFRAGRRWPSKVDAAGQSDSAFSLKFSSGRTRSRSLPSGGRQGREPGEASSWMRFQASSAVRPDRNVHALALIFVALQESEGRWPHLAA